MPRCSLSVRSRLPAAALCFAVTIALAEPAYAQCGNEVQVREGETLSGLAERCGVTETRILDLNSKVQGSKDLQAGMILKLAAPSAKDAAADARQAAESLFGRLKSYAREAGQSIEGAAETVTQSIEDFIQRNPDLHQRVRKVGQSLNIPGMEKIEAQVALSARKGAPGTPVTLSAIGLPSTQRVDIAGGVPGGDYRVVDSALTSAEGTLQVTVQLPTWADPQRDFIFVIASPTIDIAVRSATFDVLEPTSRN
jgi:ElaB/YqjD/DUF883 family membrane-anchored ribosome-binding protein